MTDTTQPGADNALDLDAIAKSKRIMAMIDDYTDKFVVNGDGKAASGVRSDIRAALMDDFEALIALARRAAQPVEAEDEVQARLAKAEADFAFCERQHTKYSIPGRLADAHAEVVAARKAVATHPSKPAVPEGFALVPLYPNAEMVRVMAEEEWAWEDLLAAAEAITEQQYNDITTHPSKPAVRDVRGWNDAVKWLRNNYQDHANVASLCDAMGAAVPAVGGEIVAMHGQIANALKVAKDLAALVGKQDHLIDYGAVARGREVIDAAIAQLGAPAGALVAMGEQTDDYERLDPMREAVSDFRKATYEFARGQDPADHAAMMEAQKRIFDEARKFASQPIPTKGNTQ
jgi:hypothetical protein